MTIWFTTPGTPTNSTSWYQEALPVGNGKLAAMVFGAVDNEQIQFNEDTIWTGQPHYYENTNSTPAHLASIRSNCFNRADILSESQTNIMSLPIREASYQPAGLLNLTFAHSGASNYSRTLDLNTATVNVRYVYDGVTFQRDVFASAPSNKVIAVRLTASTAGKLAFTCSLATPQAATNSVLGNDLVMDAAVRTNADYRYYAYGLKDAVAYEARVRVQTDGGAVTADANAGTLTVTNADAATLLLAVVPNFVNYHDLSANYPVLCSNNLAAAAALTYGQLRQAQTNDYQRLFQRVVLDLGGNDRTNQPIGYRKKQFGVDGDDPQLVALAFQMGRYLMIAGSRPGSQPLNLQGKWNDRTNLQVGLGQQDDAQHQRGDELLGRRSGQSLRSALFRWST